ncbi:8-oxo-dGTP pyrophosphatase MutT, NUDIX family [Cyclonatronum proteinivorum]|uniref:GDP-mannose pyrophosphatase n=1 Tax=Cyclonatronum proteinivorum TaxID=1457365 RepID=A0A345UPC2_9BACT|nr:NUDIX hydrolase [Cyclonatronum proteinivorum]AXJ02324.1 8-oxo-dGTP pyrophosphatase MutT, NUDIX family [Cyclonatronum proteinivorum]
MSDSKPTRDTAGSGSGVMQSQIRKWKLQHAHPLQVTRVFTLMENRMSMPDGTDAGNFYTLNAPDWVIMLAFDTNGRLITVDQYRHGVDTTSLEVPGGVIDGNDTPLETAKRELQEETGYVSDEWISLGNVSANPALFNNYCHFYLARNCRLVSGQNLDEHEDISVHLLTLTEYEEMITAGRVHHALAVAALARYYIWRSKEKG